jgi:twitching motility protein PilT
MAIQQTRDLERFLHAAADRGASELFLIPGEPVAFRVRGEIERDETDPLPAERVHAVAAAALGAGALDGLGPEAGELVTSCHLPGVVNGRMCVSRSMGQITISIALLPTGVLDVETLGLPKAIVDAATSPNGLVLFAGPYGSGKTTSAYGMLDHVNERASVHICTVEQPIAARLAPKRAIVQQREIGVDVPDCVSGIRAAMKQDLDVLLVGELRTPEEVQACLTVAETGHMVYVVMHGRSPEVAIQRLIDVQPPETIQAFRRGLAAALRGVLVQQLFPRADGKGRIAAYGVLVPDDEMRDAIRDGRDLTRRESDLPEGCQSLADHLKQLVAEGVVTEDAARKVLG